MACDAANVSVLSAGPAFVEHPQYALMLPVTLWAMRPISRLTAHVCHGMYLSRFRSKSTSYMQTQYSG